MRFSYTRVVWLGGGGGYNFCYSYHHPLVYPQFHTILEFGSVPEADELGIKIHGAKKKEHYIHCW